MNIAGETITNSSTQSSQVQSDWTQATTTALDYIKNKPTGTLTYNIPNTLVGAKWYRLGTFTAGQNGKSIKISITTQQGYNALITQPSITTLFFSTSNNSSLDPAGFAAVGTHYRTGRGNTITSVKWVGNAAGISATSYDLNVSFSGFSGESSFYSVEFGTGTTWTHNAAIVSVSDPGVASTTVGISTEELYVPTSGTFSATPAASANVLTIIGSSTTGNVVQFSNTVAEGTFIMTSKGYIGIGTTTPAEKLDVSGNVVAAGTISSGTGFMFRNRIINGNLLLWQRGTSFTSTTGAASQVNTADKWSLIYSITTGVITITRVALSATDLPFQKIGAQYSIKYTATTAASNYAYILPVQNIEAYNVNDLNWGTAYGSTVSVSLYLRTNVATNSVVSITLRNSAVTYSYVRPVIIVSSGAWQLVSFTVPAPPNGSTWNANTNGTGIQLFICGFQSTGTATVDTWVNANNIQSTGSINWAATINNYIEFTGVQLEKGIATPFEQIPYNTQLQLCQRYYYQIAAGSVFARFGVAYAVTTISSNVFIPVPVNMRAQPTLNMTFGNFKVDLGTSSQVLTSVTPATGSLVADWTANGVGITVGHAAVTAANLTGFLEAFNTTSASIGFSAEL